MTFADFTVAVVGGTLTTLGVLGLLQIALIFFRHRAGHRAGKAAGGIRIFDRLSVFVLGQKKRLDHEPMYSCVITALFLVGLFWVFTGPLPQSVIFPFANTTQIFLASSLFVGSGTCLYGIAMGTSFDIWRRLVAISRRRRGHAPQLPLDVRRAYGVGMSGTPTLIITLSYYVATLLQETPLEWTGPHALFLGFVCLGMFFHCLRFLMEIRRITKALPMLVRQEVTRRLLAADLRINMGPPQGSST